MTCQVERENENLKETIKELKAIIEDLKQQVRNDMVVTKEGDTFPECTT